MFGLKKIFSRKAVEIKQSAAKISNKDLVEAVVSGSILVAFADGTCEDSEIAALEAVLAADDSFDSWRAEIPGLIAKYAAQCQAGYRLGKIKALREIGDLKAIKADAELALVCIITVADQGGVSDEERAILKEIADTLGLRLEQYL